MPSREPELYKDKIEVSLDGRQIFYLFFGGAVIVGLVFVVGVMVGRRVESRSHLDRAETSTATDPLAALDRLERSDHAAFHGALTGNEPPTEVERAISELEKRRAAEPAAKSAVSAAGAAAPGAPSSAVSSTTAASDKRDADHAEHKKKHDDASGEPKASGDRADKSERGDKADRADRGEHGEKADRGDKAERADAKAKADKSDKPVTRPDSHADAQDARPAKSEAKADAKSDGKSDAKSDSKSDSKSDTKVAAKDRDAKDGKDRDSKDRDGKDKTRFTLQLSSFQDKAEAEAFLAETRSAGFQPYLSEADVGGKGTFYRVRLGSFRSQDAANDAKAEYDKTAKKSAQVMRL